MKIDVLCTDGSPLGVTSKTLWGDKYRIGVGGAEYALITMCEEWTKHGYQVRLYNSPHESNASPFEQLMVDGFSPTDDRDVLIVFRSPNSRAIPAKGLKVWWSCDQYTIGDFAKFSKYMDKIVCISPYHARYFYERYGIKDSVVIDLPVRLNDFGESVQKVKNRLIFTSVPDRGLANLRRIYPIIKQKIPDVSLVITSDYRLWGAPDPINHSYRLSWIDQEDVQFLGAVPRERLIKEEMEADILLYPAIYEELFCIAVAEAQCVGTYPVTSSVGALETTNMGRIVPERPDIASNDAVYVDAVVELLSDRNRFAVIRTENKVKAKIRFSPERILKEWERVFV